MLDREIWWVLRRIHTERILSYPIRIDESRPLEISPTEKDHVPPYSRQWKILQLLERQNVVELEYVSGGIDIISSLVATPSGVTDLRPNSEDRIFYTVHITDKFDSEYERYEKRFPQDSENILIFNLTGSGILSRRTPIPGDDPYSMEEGSRRHQALRALASKRGEDYIPTPNLAEEVGCTEDEFRKTCGELRKQIGDHFKGVKNRDLIDSKGRSGYRINPKARIILLP